ncbi:hypothetical protein P2318_30540 [Myxococcaceae bacterium GXIMD 01537]
MCNWRSAALLGALLMATGAACTKPQEPAPAVAPPASAPRAAAPSEGAPPAAERRSLEQPSTDNRVLPWEPVTGTADVGPLPKDFQRGQPRDVVVTMLGECAERVQLRPGGPGALTVEIFQPREGECLKRLGERHFTLKGGVLESVTAGLLPLPAPPAPPPPSSPSDGPV